VKSTLIMRDNLDAFNEAGIDLPVILGGAALTRLYVERDLRRLPQAAARQGEAQWRLRILPRAGRRAPRAVRPSVPALPRHDDVQGRAAAIGARR